ncbi:MAG: RDD family protein [Candidatus Avelusimicrobium sp.]|uniref:RDD family protein n=1 Tax=Candidatus Avelusimicrobium sp. TaxID=3048833 RepID=UPI003F02A3B4
MSRIYPYAGFWRRAVALLVDSLIIGIISSILYITVLGTQVFKLIVQNPQTSDPKNILSIMGSMILFQILAFIFFWLYFALQESSKSQATLGKRVMGLKVVGADGGRISFGRATGRTLGKLVSNMTLYFGYYMAGFTKKRQALHDLMADTFVVQHAFQTGDEKPALNFSTGGLIASILAAILPVVFIALMMLVGIVAAFKETENINVDNMNSILVRSKAVSAQANLFLLAIDEDKEVPSSDENGISYSKTVNGYQAVFSDDAGNRFVLREKKGEYDACCAEGNCELIQIDPCK